VIGPFAVLQTTYIWGTQNGERVDITAGDFVTLTVNVTSPAANGTNANGVVVSINKLLGLGLLDYSNIASNLPEHHVWTSNGSIYFYLGTIMPGETHQTTLTMEAFISINANDVVRRSTFIVQDSTPPPASQAYAA